MDPETKIAWYLAAETHREFDDYRRHDVDQTTKFVYFKLRELYWTVTRLCGLSHWHDGSNSSPSTPPRRFDKAPLLFQEVAFHATLRPRVLIDMTATSRNGVTTGIQRVVREIAKSAFERGEGLPVVIEEGRLVPYYRNSILSETIEIEEGDRFLMLDASWTLIEEYKPILQMISQRNAKCIAGLHDIFPLLYPMAVSQQSLLAFQLWFEEIVLMCDTIVCVSKSTADSFLSYALENHIALKPDLRVGWWRLGGDFAPSLHATASQQALEIGAAETRYFLSVGTIEPRKGYSLALSVFERLWASGVDVRYVIVGRIGWQCRALERRIREHSEFGRRLLWLEEVDDTDLHHLYERAYCLVLPSFAEGFGLPLLEAAQYGLPVIASDIPIFREIGGDAIHYFDLLDGDSLATRIVEALANRKTGSWSIPFYTWRQSAQELMRLIQDNAYQIQSADSDRRPAA